MADERQTMITPWRAGAIRALTKLGEDANGFCNLDER